MLCACENELERNDGRPADDVVCFDRSVATEGWGDMADKYTRSALPFTLGTDSVPCSVEVGRWDAATRGTAVTDAAQVPAMACYAQMSYNGQYLINGTAFTRNASGYYVSANPIYWPGAHTQLDFYNLAGQGYTVDTAAEGAPVLSYTAPTDVAAQSDLMMARALNVPGNNNVAVPMQLQHLLTCVRFVTGATFEQSTVTNITLSNVVTSGTLAMKADTPAWTLGTERKDYSQDLNKGVTADQAGQVLAGDGSTAFLLLPQAVDGITFSITLTGASGERTLTAALKDLPTHTWAMGAQVTYTLNVAPDGTLEFVGPEPPVQDAHYVIYKALINVTGFEGQKYTLTASASDNADVSVMLPLEAAANQTPEQMQQAAATSLANDGFWIDKVYENGVATTKSARGNSSLTTAPNGQQEVLVFLPENKTEENRTITLTLTCGGAKPISQTITQSCPAWTSSYGWEKIQESQDVQFGFTSNRKAYIVYTYNTKSSGDYTEEKIKERFNTIINSYAAASYCTLKTLSGFWGFLNYGTRVYVEIDYSKMPIVQTSGNGYENTKTLATYRGMLSGALEEAFINTKKFETGKENESAFRYKSDTDPSGFPASTGSLEVLQSAAISQIFRKNKYHLNVVSVATEKQYQPYMELADLVWFMPSQPEFSQGPPEGIRADSWSSTSSTSVTNGQLLGNGSSVARNSLYPVAAARILP